MTEVSYETRRSELKTYFDRTAKDNWVALTSNSPVSRIRQTVRAGREEMRNTLLGWLPTDLRGCRLLDAGCGTGALAIEAARRGAEVVAIDISPELVAEASARLPHDIDPKTIQFEAGDMSDPRYGSFDYVIAMDSLIHYPMDSITKLIEGFAPRTRDGILFTFAPKTPALSVMKAMGKLFPRNDRSPAIEPVTETKLISSINGSLTYNFGFRVNRTKFVTTKFYKSQAMELINS
ncbi:MAG: magnesium protoporphyrin IX methyltransferase [Rhizobiaceae bacterium]|nr:magnesium protoporphyrin IX methyltransferase [Rhizobiaceae bacterium]